LGPQAIIIWFLTSCSAAELLPAWWWDINTSFGVVLLIGVTNMPGLKGNFVNIPWVLFVAVEIGWANVVGMLFIRFSVETVANSHIAAIAKHAIFNDIFVTYIIKGTMVLAYKE
jgi:hypothetical protein